MSIATWQERYASFLGLYVAGDVGGITYYTTKRGNVVAFPKTYPDKPPTSKQLRCRSRFRLAQRNWSLLPAAVKAQWEQLMRSNVMDMTGQNAYISLSLNPDPDKLNTLNTRSGLNLAMPAYVSY